jgi:hypothetical protein
VVHRPGYTHTQAQHRPSLDLWFRGHLGQSRQMRPFWLTPIQTAPGFIPSRRMNHAVHDRGGAKSCVKVTLARASLPEERIGARLGARVGFLLVRVQPALSVFHNPQVKEQGNTHAIQVTADLAAAFS